MFVNLYGIKPGSSETREATDKLAEYVAGGLSVGTLPNVSKIKKNGGRRMIFAYVSLGEAENYRPYWKSEWSTKMPEWIDSENAQWKGNYKVKYWTDEWKKILYGTDNSCIDKAMIAGFDGVFLDVIDAYEYFENKTK